MNPRDSANRPVIYSGRGSEELTMPWRSRVRAGRELAVSFTALLAVGALIYSANAIVDLVLPAAKAEDLSLIHI